MEFYRSVYVLLWLLKIVDGQVCKSKITVENQKLQTVKICRKGNSFLINANSSSNMSASIVKIKSDRRGQSFLTKNEIITTYKTLSRISNCLLSKNACGLTILQSSGQIVLTSDPMFPANNIVAIEMSTEYDVTIFIQNGGKRRKRNVEKPKSVFKCIEGFKCFGGVTAKPTSCPPNFRCHGFKPVTAKPQQMVDSPPRKTSIGEKRGMQNGRKKVEEIVIKLKKAFKLLMRF